MAFIALAAFGLIAFNQIGRIDQPNVAFPIVVVVAQYPGASPAEMEKLVLKPLEDHIDGIEYLDRMTAATQEGVGTVAVQFKIDTNLVAAIDVQRRVDTARVYMPTDLDVPTVIKNGADTPMMTYAISSRSMSRERSRSHILVLLRPTAAGRDVNAARRARLQRTSHGEAHGARNVARI